MKRTFFSAFFFDLIHFAGFGPRMVKFRSLCHQSRHVAWRRYCYMRILKQLAVIKTPGYGNKSEHVDCGGIPYNGEKYAYCQTGMDCETMALTQLLPKTVAAYSWQKKKLLYSSSVARTQDGHVRKKFWVEELSLLSISLEWGLVGGRPSRLKIA